MNVDCLVSASLFSAAVQDGISPSILAARDPSLAPLVSMAPASGRSKNACWTPEEDEFLRQNLGFLTEQEIARRLGRSVHGVHIRAERSLRLPRPSKDPRYITTNQVALVLGVDAHKVCSWFDRGILPGEIIPSESARVYRRVLRRDFFRWALDPNNWIWFDPARVPDQPLRRFLDRKRERWGDEWWNTSRVAAYHGVDVQDVKRYIQHGKIRAVRAPNHGGRNDKPAWGHWFVLRSEATRPDLYFVKRGRGQVAWRLDIWSERADAFLVLARAVGLTSAAIAARVAWPEKRVEYRLKTIMASPELPGLIEKYGLAVEHRPDALFADWRQYQARFPSLTRSMQRWEAFLAGQYTYPCHGRYRVDSDLLAVRGVMASWARWYAPGDLAHRITHCRVSAKSLRRYLLDLRALGVDPFPSANSINLSS